MTQLSKVGESGGMSIELGIEDIDRADTWTRLSATAPQVQT